MGILSSLLIEKDWIVFWPGGQINNALSRPLRFHRFLISFPAGNMNRRWEDGDHSLPASADRGLGTNLKALSANGWAAAGSTSEH
jgi:hypothetical protein